MADEGSHLLVVDDNRMERLKLLRALQGLGYTVASADNGQLALEMLRAQSYDLVLLDIGMPGMDGYQVLEAIKGDGDLRDIPVIVVSGFDDIESVQLCMKLGAEDHLPKSFDVDALTSRVKACLEKRNS
jgi:CheY-like chemotaxis protein